MTNEQLELSLAGDKPVRQSQPRKNRATRAAWWFGQMRQMVSQAIDWDAAPEPRPEQPWLGFPQHRHSA